MNAPIPTTLAERKVAVLTQLRTMMQAYQGMLSMGNGTVLAWPEEQGQKQDIIDVLEDLLDQAEKEQIKIQEGITRITG